MNFKHVVIVCSAPMALAACATYADAPNSSSSQVSTAAAKDDVPRLSEEEIREGWIKNGSLAQFYRWYLFYENDNADVENAIDILAPDVFVKSGLGEATGHDAYRQRVLQLPKEWDNAHDVQSTKVDVNDDGSISLIADITYLNRGLMPNAQVRTAGLTYTTKLMLGDDRLPKFQSLEIAQNSDGTATEFVDQYANNRTRSLMHYWLALLENPDRNAAPFKEILADDFSLNFTSGAITDFAGFEAWYAGPASSIAASTHVPKEIKVMEIAPGQFSLEVVFDWNGIAPDGTKLVARTKHSWIVEDDPSDRFAKIKQVDVEALVPFKPA